MTRQPKAARPSLAMRALRGIGRLTLTALVIGGSAFAVISGSEFLAARAAANAPTAKSDPIPVHVREIALDSGYTIRRSFVGQIEARQSVNLSFEFSGRVEEILVDEGDAVARGEVLARLDTRLLEAERDQLRASREAVAAQLGFAEQTLERAQELNTRGFASQERLDEAMARRTELTARIAEIDAGLRRVALQLEKSELVAPDAGRITARLFDGGEALSPGQTVLGLVEDGRTQVRVGLPLSVDLDRVDAATIEVGPQRHAATRETVRPDVDPVTRTRTVLFSIASDAAQILGQTAVLHLEEAVSVAGIWVPTRLLKEAERGAWSLMLVDGQGTVRRALVEVIHTEGAEAYVRGTFPGEMRLIAKGPHRVTPGQQVVIEAEG